MKRLVYTIFICIIIVNNTIISHPSYLPTNAYVQDLERRAREQLRSAQEHKDIYQICETIFIQGQLQACVNFGIVDNREQLQSTIVQLRTETERATDEIIQIIGETTYQTGIHDVQKIMGEIASRRPLQ